MRDSFKVENPEMTFGELSKFTSSMYGSLTPEEKARWEDAALQDKARYQSEMASYQPPPGFGPDGTLLVEFASSTGSRRYTTKKGKKDKVRLGGYVCIHV